MSDYGRYERIIMDVLALATEADHFGELDEPGCLAFFDLAAELHGALFLATKRHLPEGVLAMLANEVRWTAPEP